MDQIYLPKNRIGLVTGSFVLIKPLEQEIQQKSQTKKLHFYKIQSIEPLKLQVINEIIKIIDKKIKNDNIIFIGSFLEEGFNFNDVDILIITNQKYSIEPIKKELEEKQKIKIHLIQINNKTLLDGLSKDPLYPMMLSKCVAKKRFIFKIRKEIDYKILDLHLLKSKLLIDNFNTLDGNEKYYLTRNMIAIFLCLDKQKISQEIIDKEIKIIFNLKRIEEIKKNMLNKNSFLTKYKKIYNETQRKIFRGIKNDSKQKQID